MGVRAGVGVMVGDMGRVAVRVIARERNRVRIRVHDCLRTTLRNR